MADERDPQMRSILKLPLKKRLVILAQQAEGPIDLSMSGNATNYSRTPPFVGPLNLTASPSYGASTSPQPVSSPSPQSPSHTGTIRSNTPGAAEDPFMPPCLFPNNPIASLAYQARASLQPVSSPSPQSPSHTGTIRSNTPGAAEDSWMPPFVVPHNLTASLSYQASASPQPVSSPSPQSPSHIGTIRRMLLKVCRVKSDCLAASRSPPPSAPPANPTRMERMERMGFFMAAPSHLRPLPSSQRNHRIGRNQRRTRKPNGASSNENTQKIWFCAACGKPSPKPYGYHYNAATCEGCKGFFKRTIQNSNKTGMEPECKKGRNCIIKRGTRTLCQWCRLQQCLEANMRRELVKDEPSRKKLNDTKYVNKSWKNKLLPGIDTTLSRSEATLLHMCSLALYSIPQLEPQAEEEDRSLTLEEFEAALRGKDSREPLGRDIERCYTFVFGLVEYIQHKLPHVKANQLPQPNINFDVLENGLEQLIAELVAVLVFRSFRPEDRSLRFGNLRLPHAELKRMDSDSEVLRIYSEFFDKTQGTFAAPLDDRATSLLMGKTFFQYDACGLPEKEREKFLSAISSCYEKVNKTSRKIESYFLGALYVAGQFHKRDWFTFIAEKCSIRKRAGEPA